MDETARNTAYRFFTEAGIISQFANTIIERHLPERMTNQHYGLLGHISRRPEGSTPQQLAYAFQIPKTSMTHMLRVLEEIGYIVIAPNPKDARSKVARITESGLTLLVTAMDKAAADIARMNPPMNLDLMTKTMPALTAIREQLDAARDNE